MTALARFAFPLGVLVAVLGGAVAIGAVAAEPAPPRDAWSAADRATLAAMHIDRTGPTAADPSNAYQGRDDAARLGQALFQDARFSRDGRVSCASCHAPDGQFEDGRPLGQGQSTGRRRTMPVMGAHQAPFLFWDGRKDSLWSQALGPLEDAAEHGSNRVRIVRLVAEHHRSAYEAVFGRLPVLTGLPDDASPLGDARERAAWSGMPDQDRERINRVFANLGKAIAAYEARVRYGPSRFDRYVEATLAGDGRAQAVLSPQEVRGLRVFLGPGQCATCHNGPLLSDQAFHNTGVPPADRRAPDRGRADGVPRLLADEFNCQGRYSDAPASACGELDFIAADDPAQLAAFRTPSLRNVAARAPYMHAGQFATLEDVVRHYARAPQALLGHSELARPTGRAPSRRAIVLAEPDVADLVAFLGALTGPVRQPR